ncbi:MAG TPA: N-acetylglucosamine-6-phosphate deacetylase, partial [Armatimonadota bacterium]|nr:N-acetylglucosamine-6-phosphate deacetylase [Armatimonadota bacterium]
MPVLLYGSIAGTSGVSEVTITGEHIEAVRPAPAGAPASDLIIAPGFFDIQINGYGGCSLSGGDSTPDTLRYMTRALRQAGVLFFCPTLTTNSFENLQAAMRAVARARQDTEVAHAAPCIHLEGPYIAREDGPRGAHA